MKSAVGRRWFWFLMVLSFISLPWIIPSDSLAQSLLTLGNYVKVSEKRITRTVYEYTYRVDLTNTGLGVLNAAATATSNNSATTLVDGNLSFGDVSAGTTVKSSDTFTFRHDRLYPFQWSNIVWSISFTQPLDDASTTKATSLLLANALAQGNVNQALNLTDPSRRTKFEALFQRLGPTGMAEVGAVLQTSVPVFVGKNIAEYEGFITLPSGENIIGKYTLIKTPDGWKIDGL